MTFYSINGCSITMAINFPEIKNNAKPTSKVIDEVSLHDEDTKMRRKKKGDPFDKLLDEIQNHNLDFV